MWLKPFRSKIYFNRQLKQTAKKWGYNWNWYIFIAVHLVNLLLQLPVN